MTVSPLRNEDGFTLVEVLIVSVLMIVVLGATLTALSTFQRNVSTNDRQNDAQDELRNAMDLMSRDLRNLASPTTDQPDAIDVMEPNQVVFQSEGKEMPAGSLNTANTIRVRYCVSPDGKLYRQTQTWTSATFPPLPDSSTCPGDGTWPTTKAVAGHVVNGERPVFSYNAAVPDEVTEITSSLFVDVNPGSSPAEQTLRTSVYLRNQNRRPTGSFSLALANSGTQIIMNASGSTDPEEKALFFTWFVDGAMVTAEDGGNVVHTAVVDPGVHSVKLMVSDGTLSDIPPQQTICVPAPAQGVNCD
jgi:type II secretory pathway pseudopilin PulG